MEAYSLIARDKTTDEVKIIPINERWYLGTNGRDIAFNRVSLEAIDLVTMRFPSALKMIEQMYKNGYISTTDVDLFIAKKVKKNGSEYIKTYELIYNPSDKERVEDLKVIAYSYLIGQKDSVKSLIDKISNKLISKANSKEDFRNILACKMTNISSYLTDAFWKGVQSYSLKYQNRQIFENYSTIRNIIEALNRYDYLSTLDGDVFINSVAFLNENGSSRKKVEPFLLKILDNDYLPGQYSLLDFECFLSEIEENEETRRDLEKQENSQLTKEELAEIQDISFEEKRKIILQTFFQLPFSFLKVSEGMQNICPDFFSKEYPLTFDEQKLLETLLPNGLALTLETYTAHKNEYSKCLANYSSTFLLENEIRLDERKISKKLKNNKSIDKIYLWVLIYKKYLQKLHDFENSSRKKVK